MEENIFKFMFEKWEISRLHNMLDEEGISHVYRKRFDGYVFGEVDIDWGYQILIPAGEKRKLSIIEGAGTYGFTENLLERAVLSDKGVHDVQGWLTVEEVFEWILSEIFDADERRGYTKITDEEWEKLNGKNMAQMRTTESST